MKNPAFKSDIYSISFDEKSNGYIVSFVDGNILSSKELIELCQGILKFINTYTDEEIERENKKRQEEWFASMYTDNNPLDDPYHICYFKKNAHLKEGIVYVFQDKASGHVRAIKTTEKSYESSMRSKQSSSFEGIKILYKTSTKHQNLLSEFLNIHAERIRNNPQYVMDEEYLDDMNKWIKNEVKVTRYKCKNCKNIINSMEDRSYIRCSKCFSNFCTVNCWNEHTCSPRK